MWRSIQGVCSSGDFSVTELSERIENLILEITYHHHATNSCGHFKTSFPLHSQQHSILDLFLLEILSSFDVYHPMLSQLFSYFRKHFSPLLHIQPPLPNLDSCLSQAQSWALSQYSLSGHILGFHQHLSSELHTHIYGCQSVLSF